MGYSVRVEKDGELLICIESQCYYGKGELSDEESDLVRDCATELMSFIGPKPASTCGKPAESIIGIGKCWFDQGHDGPCAVDDIPF